MLNLTWQSTIAQYTDLQTQIDNYPRVNALSPYALLPRFSQSIERFLTSASFPHFLLVCADDDSAHYQLLAAHLQQYNSKVVEATHFDEKRLFGAYYSRSNTHPAPQQVTGLLQQAHQGILLVSLDQLLEQATLWQRLKHSVTSGSLSWKAADDKYAGPLPSPAKCQVKVILVGSRESMSFFEELEPTIHQLSVFAEYEQDIAVSADNIERYLGVVKGFAEQFSHKTLTGAAVHRLMQVGNRFTEDQQRVPLCPMWFRTLLSEADFQAKQAQITPTDIDAAVNQRDYRHNYLAERALQDMLQKQVVIETECEKIGQVNGLTLLSIPGHPTAFGEPARISCVVHVGDGEITDVERKAELGGNIHAKGMMIMQAFVQSLLNVKEALPYSASIVFEQSYCEVDGDSASVAELCALISALALQPIKQQIALTGSADQFGQVQAVGGINEKIEGFFALCAARGLTGEQGVIIPHSNINALCLKEEVISAIKAKQFHIWPIRHVAEALLLLTDMPLISTDEQQESLLDKIAERIEILHQHEDNLSLLTRISHWLARLVKTDQGQATH